MSSMALVDLLRSTPCSQVGAMVPIVTLDEATTMERACKVLSEHSLQSAPITSSSGPHVIDWVDLHDVAVLLLMSFAKEGLPADDDDLERVLSQRLPKLAPVSVAPRLHKDRPANNIVLHPSESALEAMILFNQDRHRILLGTRSGEQPTLSGMLTQTDLIRFCADKIHAYPAASAITMQDVMTPSPLSVRSSDPLLSSLLEMHRQNVYAAPVVDDSNGGRLVDCLSMTDVGVIFQRKTYSCLHMTVGELAGHVHKRSKLHQVVEQVVASRNDTLGDVLHRILDAHVHRVFIIDDHHVPIGVVSMTDLLQAIARCREQPPPTPPSYPTSPTLLTCGGFPQDPSREIYTVPTNATVQDVCRVMADKGISSIPVVSPTGQCAGLFDYYDLGALLVGGARHHRVSQSTGVDEFIRRGILRLIPVNVVTAAFRSPQSDIRLAGTNLVAALSDAHSVAIVDETLKKVSQSDVLRYMARMNPPLGIMARRIDELNVVDTSFMTVAPGSTLLSAIEAMIQKETSSAAVVDNGKLVGNLSLSDLKYVMRAAMISTLASTVSEFLGRVRNCQACDPNTSKDIPEGHAGISVRPSDLLGIAVAKMASAGIHRAWVVDDNRGVLGAVSIGNVLRAIRAD